ncbi:adenosylcobinamide-GDP ribazoletransferase [Rhizobiaceae bacterium BDR2-2]|uniref:Adenosylcobinamide-GDP ribazoletransferase n=1 Tax=Ectorhizobium quercum TaxID=2965071 RepID=A0AAE3N755_9HYPH|nr:adenosylcobinamide-GDP ribazoletransferase [Ectorhizobium quercum]MCX8999812.1 adenosylcobinamide-GDP ribazoletransferase [Ectorhizobium quercum]
MTMPSFLRNILVACAFLGRVPVPGRVFDGFDGRMGAIAHAFPVAGFLVALPGALLFWLMLTLGTDALVAALLALSLQALVTGALHEDGLADCADGFGGGRSREEVLDIMKDSRIGTFGAIALFMSFALRAAMLASVAMHLPPLAAAFALPASGTLARTLMVAHWQALPPAREQGLATSAGQPDLAGTARALAIGTVLAGIPVIAVFGLPALFLALSLGGIAAFAMTRLAARRINGHTGDTIGAVEQIGEIAVLLAFSLTA